MEIDLEERVASLRVRDVSVTDAHDLYNNLTNGLGFPALGVPPVAPVPAMVSFDIEWSGIPDSAKVVNAMQNFRGRFVRSGATIDWTTESANSAFQSESPSPARNVYPVTAHH